jgi:hypothetical protein
MKLTKLHIFLILLIALVLCSCLGMCSSTEGFTSIDTSNDTSNDTNKTYHSYGKYYDNMNDANISATDWSQGLDATHKNPYYNKNDDFHKNYKKNNYSYKDDDLNGGNNDNTSSYMISTSYKDKNHSNNNYNSYNKNNRRESSNNNMFDSVSSGAMNGSTYSYSGDNNGSNDDSNDDSNGITQDQIPNGQEDLYILKSQALTPICPACPPPPKVDCDTKCGKSKCPPCPPCARCPEPQFDCVKVPNYNTTNLDQNLPIPWMAKL